MATTISGLNDRFDVTEADNMLFLDEFYNQSSSAFDSMNSTLNIVEGLAEGQLNLNSVYQGIVQDLLNLLVVSLNGSPTSLSAQVVLEAYHIALNQSGSSHSITGGGITDAQSDFADCVVNATSSQSFKQFRVFNYNVSASATNSSSSGRRGRSLAATAAVAAGGRGGGGSSSLNNQAVDAYGYSILYGEYYANLKYNLYDTWNQNPKRCVGEGCRNSLLSGLFVHVTQRKSSTCDPSSRFSKLTAGCSGQPLA
jgi:hypothetical protein